MRKFFDKAKSSLSDGRSQFPSSHNKQQPMKEHDTPSTIRPPSKLDILRYRYHHGTNLGSIFVLEQWLHGSMFEPGAKGASELDAVNAYVHEPYLRVILYSSLTDVNSCSLARCPSAVSTALAQSGKPTGPMLSPNRTSISYATQLTAPPSAFQ